MKKITVFLIIFFLLLLLLNSVYLNFALSHHLLERTDEQFQQYKKNTQIIVMGDSHTKDALNPLFIDNSFNFASQGELSVQTYYKFRTILRDKEFKPKILVLPLDLATFSSFRAGRFRDYWYWKRYIDEKEVPAFKEYTHPLQRLFPILGQGEKIFMPLILKFIKKERELIKGHLSVKGDFSKAKNKSRVALDVANQHFKNARLIDKDLFLYFKKILDLAQERNIKVALIKFPLTKEYYDKASKYIPDEEAYYGKIKKLTNNYNNVRIFDYQKTFFDNGSLFINSDHLNYWGAEILSKKFNDDLKKVYKITKEDNSKKNIYNGSGVPWNENVLDLFVK